MRKMHEQVEEFLHNNQCSVLTFAAGQSLETIGSQ